MAGWTKLDSGLIHSTIWREPDHVRIIWITMLAMSEADGVVHASIPGLADAARISLDDTKDALNRLSSPDEYSRTPDNDGRRIDSVDGGWLLLNHGKYRGGKVDRTNAERQKKWRAKSDRNDNNALRNGVTESNDRNGVTSVYVCDPSGSGGSSTAAGSPMATGPQDSLPGVELPTPNQPPASTAVVNTPTASGTTKAKGKAHTGQQQLSTALPPEAYTAAEYLRKLVRKRNPNSTATGDKPWNARWGQDWARRLYDLHRMGPDWRTIAEAAKWALSDDGDPSGYWCGVVTSASKLVSSWDAITGQMANPLKPRQTRAERDAPQPRVYEKDYIGPPSTPEERAGWAKKLREDKAAADLAREKAGPVVSRPHGRTDMKDVNP